MNPLTEIKFKIPFDQIQAEHVEPAIDELLVEANKLVGRPRPIRIR
jgi:Zn-dependent oligopeptidase